MVEFPIPTGPISTVLWLALAPNGDIWFTEWSGNKIGVVAAKSTVPLQVSANTDFIELNGGQYVTVPLQIKVLRGLGGNGTLQYAWGSYNPQDASVAFSPQYPLLAGPAEILAQAELNVSTTTEPGNYTLALGIETPSVNVWTMISVEVMKPSPFNPVPLSLAALGGGVVLAILLFIVLRRKSNRAPH
jgi:hypothetical protein